MPAAEIAKLPLCARPSFVSVLLATMLCACTSSDGARQCVSA
jgi:hypothetical protein